MKVISYSESGHPSTARYVVELDDREAHRVIGDYGMTAIKKRDSHKRLGMEIDLTPLFNKGDSEARKASQLDTLVRIITESKTLVFPGSIQP